MGAIDACRKNLDSQRGLAFFVQHVNVWNAVSKQKRTNFSVLLKAFDSTVFVVHQNKELILKVKAATQLLEQRPSYSTKLSVNVLFGAGFFCVIILILVDTNV